MPTKTFLSGGRELSQISQARDVHGLSTWVASLFKRTIDAVNQTSQAAVSTNDVTGAAAQVVATPASSSGAAAPTTLTTAYLANAPATASAIGAVKPDGTTITVSSGGVISAASAEPPSGPGNEVYATPNGSSGAAELRALVPADLPVATTGAFGAVKPDGSTIDVSAGVISVPTATDSALGLVKPDGTTITISAGVITAAGGGGGGVPAGLPITPGVNGTGSNTGWAGWTTWMKIAGNDIVQPVTTAKAIVEVVGGKGISISEGWLFTTARKSQLILSSPAPVQLTWSESTSYLSAFSGITTSNPFRVTTDSFTFAPAEDLDYYFYFYLNSDSTGYNTDLTLSESPAGSSPHLWSYVEGNSIPSGAGADVSSTLGTTIPFMVSLVAG